MKTTPPIFKASGWRLAIACAIASFLLQPQRAAAQEDYGDAPFPYPTTINDDGARHFVDLNFFLGSNIDADNDGQPSATALGDDNNPVGAADDEDGVTFTTSLVAGQSASVRVLLNAPFGDGSIDAWMDFNQDGDWADAGEQILVSRFVSPGFNTLSFNVPGNAVDGDTYARFRLGLDGNLSYNGEGGIGEVEDYLVTVQGQTFDFGDAPGNYPTTLANNGARHDVNEGFCLGTLVDDEGDGQPNGTATGDDGANLDDEDGVIVSSPLVPGQVGTASIFLTESAGLPSRLDAWVDFNQNGSWADSGERIATSFVLNAGFNTLTFPVPSSAVSGATFARFRLSTQGGQNITGYGGLGEVEDYQVTVQQQLDFGDAPAPYPTLLTNNGARHAYNPEIFLGASIDVEPDGQPDGAALGDDFNDGSDDEDGVQVVGQWVVGRNADVNVTVSTDGLLNAWMDFNQDGDWADAGEQIFVKEPVIAGLNALSFSVPADAKPGGTYARYRFTAQDYGISYDGLAPDGEVEDHQARFAKEEERCDLTCMGRDFWLTFPGNYAPDSGNPVRPELCIIGPAGANVSVEIPGLAFVQNVVIPAAGRAIVSLPKEADLGNLNDGILERGIHVTSNSDVTVHAYNQVYYTTDSYLGLPSSVLGQEHVVLAFGNEHTGVPPLNGTQFAIVACDPDTKVTITPSVDTGARQKGVPYDVLLQAGECYQLRNTDDAPADLTGTLISSDKPVAVFGGHRTANVPSANEWFTDHLVEQLLPMKSWGNVFYTAPLATRTGGDTFRCLAGEDNTTVSLNGGPVGTINRGEFIELSLASGAQISADKRILVAQYANSSDRDGVVDSDPFMSLVPATRHYSSAYAICVPDTNFTANYVNVIAPSASINSILLDGGFTPGPFVAIGATGLSYTQIPLTPGRHTLTGATLFTAMVYGWAEYESYGHPACFFFGDLARPNINPDSTSVSVNVDDGSAGGTPGIASVPRLSSATAPDDNCDPEPPTVTQVPEEGTPLTPGIYTLTFSALDTSGNQGFTNITLTVLDPTPVQIQCPSNIVVDCTSTNGAVVDFVVTANTTYSTNVTVVSTPPSGSVFPPGITQVDSVATSLAGNTNTCSFLVEVRCASEMTTQVISDGTELQISWEGSPGVLEKAPTVVGPWEVANPQFPFPVNSTTVPIATTGNMFFRVRY